MDEWRAHLSPRPSVHQAYPLRVILLLLTNFTLTAALRERYCYHPISQVRKLRHRKIRKLVQAYPAGELGSQDLHSGNVNDHVIPNCHILGLVKPNFLFLGPGQSELSWDKYVRIAGTCEDLRVNV